MCVACYLSTDREIAEIPFDENDRKFNIHDIHGKEERPVGLTKKFVYYCGSSTCCGCNFGMAGFTEEILAHIRRELVREEEAGETYIYLPEFWHTRNIAPPTSVAEFDENVEEYRQRRSDTLALYRLIQETREAGYECEVSIGWEGFQTFPPCEIHEIKPGEEISLNFDDHGDEFILYRFLKQNR